MIGLACVLFLDLGSAGVLRWWAVVLLLVVWVVLFVLACAWWTPHPRRLPWLAAVGLVLWVLVVVGVNLAARLRRLEPAAGGGDLDRLGAVGRAGLADRRRQVVADGAGGEVHAAGDHGDGRAVGGGAEHLGLALGER